MTYLENQKKFGGILDLEYVHWNEHIHKVEENSIETLQIVGKDTKYYRAIEVIWRFHLPLTLQDCTTTFHDDMMVLYRNNFYITQDGMNRLRAIFRSMKEE